MLYSMLTYNIEYKRWFKNFFRYNGINGPWIDRGSSPLCYKYSVVSKQPYFEYEIPYPAEESLEDHSAHGDTHSTFDL
jgi:hypothetical protein